MAPSTVGESAMGDAGDCRKTARTGCGKTVFFFFLTCPYFESRITGRLSVSRPTSMLEVTLFSMWFFPDFAPEFLATRSQHKRDKSDTVSTGAVSDGKKRAFFYVFICGGGTNGCLPVCGIP